MVSWGPRSITHPAGGIQCASGGLWRSFPRASVPRGGPDRPRNSHQVHGIARTVTAVRTPWSCPAFPGRSTSRRTALVPPARTAIGQPWSPRANWFSRIHNSRSVVIAYMRQLGQLIAKEETLREVRPLQVPSESGRGQVGSQNLKITSVVNTYDHSKKNSSKPAKCSPQHWAQYAARQTDLLPQRHQTRIL